MATASSSSGRPAAREPASAAAVAARKPGNYTSLNLQSYKGGRSDGKPFGESRRQVVARESVYELILYRKRQPWNAELRKSGGHKSTDA